MSFTGKTAVITGGGSGIGRACALGLGKQGTRVAVWDVNGANAASVADEVKELGVRAFSVSVDVSKREQIETAAGRTFDEFGRIDILVNKGYHDLSLPGLRCQETRGLTTLMP